jgi:trehalose 6-phosphate synthase/phosphatase
MQNAHAHRQELCDAYVAAQSRLILLDYDGTLAEIAPTPPEAAPTPEILQTLGSLAADAANTVVIVSGRKRDELDEWLGDLPLHFAAEHGFWHRASGEQWQTSLGQDTSWQDAPRALMQPAVDRLAGSFIEAKHSGIVWHYRQVADQVAAEQEAKYLIAALNGLDPERFRAATGSKIVEVQLLGADKGTAVRPWLAREWDFILAAGDDRTDEEMLSVMPEDAFTVRVGSGNTVARLRLASPAHMRELLRELAALDKENEKPAP